MEQWRAAPLLDTDAVSILIAPITFAGGLLVLAGVDIS